MPPQSRNTSIEDGDDRNRVVMMRRITSGADINLLEEPEREYRLRKSSLIGMIDWTHVILTHAPQMMALGIVILFCQVVHQAVTSLGGHLGEEWWTLESLTRIALEVTSLLVRLYESIVQSNGFDIFSPAIKTTALCLLVGFWFIKRQKPVYLLSFATFKPPESWKLTHAEISNIIKRQNCFTDQSLHFLDKILERSGTGQATAWPPGIVQHSPADASIKASRQEAETMIFAAVEEALRKANAKPRDIDILIINCSLFSPTPSLCAMVLSHFHMRSDVATYNLSGMGCAAGLVSIDLAKQLLTGRSSNAKALVVSTEILTPNFYHGNDRAFLIQNTLFRCGAAAIVLSSSWWDGRRAWYKLLHTVRVQGTGEVAYDTVFEEEDAEGHRGIRLSKDIVKVAGKCMEKNFTVLGPSVLPFTEQAMVVISVVTRFVLKEMGKLLCKNGYEKLANKLPAVKPYVPDFKRGIDHFCIHAGGRAVIDGIEKNLGLHPFHTEASRMTLLNYGNTSSSSIWYELEYIQEQQKSNPLKKGDRVLQIAFGSGFKCTSGVWLKL